MGRNNIDVDIKNMLLLRYVCKDSHRTRERQRGDRNNDTIYIVCMGISKDEAPNYVSSNLCKPLCNSTACKMCPQL